MHTQGEPVPPPESLAEPGQPRVRVYEYGCVGEAVSGLDTAIEQMRRRTELWNRMADIDNEIRTKMEAALYARKGEKKLQLLRDKLAQLRKRLAAALSSDGSSSRQARELREAIKKTAAKARAGLEDVKRARKENAEKNRALLRELDDDRLERIREAQANAGLYWCSRMEVRRRYDVARARAMRAGRRLQTRMWDGTGSVCVYFPKGLSAEGVFGDNGRLQIDPVSPGAWNSPSRSLRRRLARTRLRMRVAATADGSPVWLEFPIVMHRPLPAGGIIRWVSIVRERIGVSWRHRVLLTVRVPPPSESSQASGAVGIDVGWRITPDGLRVAYWYGEDGRHGALVLPNQNIKAFSQVGSLQATISAAHEEVRTFLRSYMLNAAMPSPLASLAEAAVASASPQDLFKLFEEWSARRFRGDKRAFSKLQAWHKQHLHLWTWQANLRDQLIRTRRELYRRFAAELANQYSRVFVKDVQLRRISARPIAARDVLPSQRHHRFIAALSILFRILGHAVEKHGGTFMRLKMEDATSCHVCECHDDWDPSADLTHTCSSCSATWDQGYNAAVLTLRGGLSIVPR